jgi:hypothetical protein
VFEIAKGLARSTTAPPPKKKKKEEETSQSHHSAVAVCQITDGRRRLRGSEMIEMTEGDIVEVAEAG